MRVLIAPNVKRSIAFAGAPTNIIVPAGQVYEIFSAQLTTLVTAASYWYIAVDGKTMYWAPGEANFDPSLGYLAALNPFYEIDKENMSRNRIPILATEGQVITIGSSDLTGVVQIHYRVHTLESGLTQESDGGVYGKRRMIFSHSRTVDNVAIGATEDCPMVTSSNAPGETTFPWASNVPPDRRYYILGVAIQVSDVVGTNLARNGVRLLHEGRELITPAGLVQTPGVACPFISAGALWNIFVEPYAVNNFEQVQGFIRVTSTDAGPQDATLMMGLLMIEEYLK